MRRQTSQTAQLNRLLPHLPLERLVDGQEGRIADFEVEDFPLPASGGRELVEMLQLALAWRGAFSWGVRWYRGWGCGLYAGTRDRWGIGGASLLLLVAEGLGCVNCMGRGGPAGDDEAGPVGLGGKGIGGADA